MNDWEVRIFDQGACGEEGWLAWVQLVHRRTQRGVGAHVLLDADLNPVSVDLVEDDFLLPERLSRDLMIGLYEHYGQTLGDFGDSGLSAEGDLAIFARHSATGPECVACVQRVERSLYQ